MTINTTPATQKSRNPWSWIPTLYFGQGLPYMVVMSLSTVMYKNLGISNTEIAFYTSWLYLPWVIKPLWSPLVDMFRTKRYWIVVLQFLVGASLALVALTIPTSHFFQITIAVMWLMAFSSATHDIAADGFYMLALKEHEQAAFVGVRSTFYRIANLAGQGGLVYLVGELTAPTGKLVSATMASSIGSTGNFVLAWSIVFWVLAGLFGLLFVYHAFILPRPASDTRIVVVGNAVEDFWVTFKNFFMRKDIALILIFLLTFRLGEAQALKLVAPFLLDPRAAGGLGLTNTQLSIVYGTWGVIALTLGGLLGGYTISRGGLKKWIWPMLFAVHIPNLAFVFLASTQPSSEAVIATAIVIEQFGYGFGFAAYLMFMIMVADNDGKGIHKTAHYAICTGFMAAGMMLPGMISGWIQSHLGYPNFFVWVLVCTIPSIVVTFFLKIDPAFGKKTLQDKKA